MIPVVWKSFADSPARDYWDQTILEWLFDQTVPGGFRFQHSDTMPDGDGLILVTPGHWRQGTPITEALAPYRWVLMILTSDEEGDCPYWEVDHPNLLMWRTFPRPNFSHQPDRYVPLGWTPGTLEANQTRADKTTPWLFAGQVTHTRRQQAVAAARAHLRDGGVLFETPGFTQGWSRDEYFKQTRMARVVLCPSGPNHPDTFRMYEALESGCVPIADLRSPNGVVDPWGRTFHTRPLFPIVDDWNQIKTLVPDILDGWPDSWHRVAAWWQQTKRALVWQLHDDLIELSGSEPPHLGADQRVTALVPTSPISAHPDTAMIWETLHSIQTQLPDAEILVMIDGIRPEQEHYRERYDEYKTRLLWELNQTPITPILFDEFQHQANMTRRGLEQVRTGLILFVEHDTPLIGHIPWKQVGHKVLDDTFNLVRFHYDHTIHPEHEYLMQGPPETIGGVGYQRTRQWSQRPHLARTPIYRQWVDLIAGTSRTMIEDALHGPCADGDWDDWRLAIYHPEGDIQRSANLDGRQDDPKYPMVYE